MRDFTSMNSRVPTCMWKYPCIYIHIYIYTNLFTFYKLFGHIQMVKNLGRVIEWVSS